MRKVKPLRRYLNKYEQIFLRNLRNNDKIVVLRVDKGGTIVFMDKDNYMLKMNEDLNYGSYINLNTNPMLIN